MTARHEHILERWGLKPDCEVWLEAKGSKIFTSEIAAILGGIESLGSIKATANSLGVTYAHAWNSIARVENFLKTPLIVAKRGGADRGGASLTETSQTLLDQFNRLSERIRLRIEKFGSRRSLRTRLFGRRVSGSGLNVIGSHCTGVEKIVEEILSTNQRARIDVSNVGSSGGLAAIMLGEADVAGVHLLDTATGKYNIPFLRRYWIERKAMVVRGYQREIGLAVSKGNAKKIRGFGDLLRRDVRFINRNLGSGTRLLTDHLLWRLSKDRDIRKKNLGERIRGYEVEAWSHVEVAETIKNGKADVGVLIKSVADSFELDFIPVWREWFDFVVSLERLRKKLVSDFLKTLKDKELMEQIRNELPGLHPSPETGKVIYTPHG